MPRRRLEKKGGWAQCKIVGKRNLAYAFRGQEIKDKYRLTGNTLLRVVTADRAFDQTFKIDIEIEEFPF